MTHLQTQLLSNTVTFETVTFQIAHKPSGGTALRFRPINVLRFAPSAKRLREVEQERIKKTKTAQEELAYFEALLEKRMVEANSEKHLEEAKSTNDEDFERLIEANIEVVCLTMKTLKLSDVSELGRRMVQEMLSDAYGRLSEKAFS